MIVLAGDIGGTNARLAFIDIENGRSRILRREVFESDQFDGLAAVVHRFLAGAERKPDCAGFGVPCPIRDGPCKLANLDWTVDPDALARDIGIPNTSLINDFEAIAYAVPLLGKEDLETIQDKPAATGGVIGILGAGTGLGHAFLYRDQGRWEVLPSEGGHCNFAPRDEFEIEMLRYWMKQLGGRVSWERVLSGPGLERVYRFIVDTGRITASPDIEAAMTPDDAPAIIAKHGLDRSDRACTVALHHFVSIFGAAAGNLALAAVATGGIYLAGGVAPRIIPALRNGTFLDAFHNMGRLSYIPKNTPVHVITNPHTGLIGAAFNALNKAT